jgi:hypothetical protein
MSTPTKEVGFSPRHQVKGRAKARLEVLEGEREELRQKIGALRFEIDRFAALINSGAKPLRSPRNPYELLAQCAHLLEECAEHLAKR